MSRWRVSQLRADTVEIIDHERPGVRYVLQASPGTLRVEVWDGDQLAEDALVARAVNEFIFESSDRSGLRMRVAMSQNGDAIVSHLRVGDEDVRVASLAMEHSLRLGAELRTRKMPEHPLGQVLADALKRDDTLVGEIKKYTQYGDNVMRAKGLSNGVVAGCVAACFLCSLGSFAGCVACAICIEMALPSPPPLTVLSE
jgi:hypothetical protein